MGGAVEIELKSKNETKKVGMEVKFGNEFREWDWS